MYYPGKILSMIPCRLLIISVLFLLVTQTRATGQERDEIDFFDPETWLLGDFSYNALINTPHNTWFDSGFNDYIIDDTAFMELEKAGINDTDILVVMGTWCSDSRREVPRFLKIIESIGYDRDRIRFIGVDSYKNAPVDDYVSFDIERVPTFIFYRNKVELGRIIEYPEASLERDMVNILTDR